MKLLTHPDLELGRVCEPVTEFNDELKELTDEMFEIMYANNGIGLAAPQIGVYKQIFVMDVSIGDARHKQVFVNPKVVSIVGWCKAQKEGCLSFPGETVDIERSDEVRIQFQDEDGSVIPLMICAGLVSRCIQHEMDHLNGKCIIDYLSKLKRDIILKGIEKKGK